MNGPHKSTSSGYRFSDEIPEHYREPIVVALPCNPFRLYVYWEHPAITPGTATQWFLRYHQAGGNDIDDMPKLQISSQSGEHFLDVPVPGAHYIVELIQVNADGAGTVLLRSEHEMPTATPKTQTASFPCRNTQGLITTPKALTSPHAEVPTEQRTDSPIMPLPVPAQKPVRSHSSWSLQGRSAS